MVDGNRAVNMDRSLVSGKRVVSVSAIAIGIPYFDIPTRADSTRLKRFRRTVCRFGEGAAVEGRIELERFKTSTGCGHFGFQ